MKQARRTKQAQSTAELESLGRFVGRVGTEPTARLAWAVAFAQRDPEQMTGGDWENAVRELAVYLGPYLVTVGQALAAKEDEPLGVALGWHDRPAWWARVLGDKALGQLDTDRAQSVQRVLARAIAQIMTDAAPLETPHTTATPVSLTGPRGPRRLVSAIDRAPVTVLALRAVADDLEAASEQLRVCAAPLRRTDRPCGTWFVQTRPQQAYCSHRCRSRAATRAARAAQQTRTRGRTARRKASA